MIPGEEYDCLTPGQRYKAKLKARRDAERGPQPTLEERAERAAEAHRRGNAAYTERHPERVKAAGKRWREKNGVARNAEDRAARALDAAHRDHLREKDRQRYAANPEPQRAAARAWYAANRERAAANRKAWQKANIEKHRARQREWARRKRAKAKSADQPGDSL